jgi:DNA mismatch endonuclease, patch repair protein
MDSLSKRKRSWNMSRITAKDTNPEIFVRSLLHRLGYRFRLHSKKIFGRPDIVLAGRKTVIFVNGCFWHRHKNCRYAYTPKSRITFWEKKFILNIARDQLVYGTLRELGWRIVVVWECEIRFPDVLVKRLKREIPDFIN